MKFTTLFSAVAMAATALPLAEATRGRLRSLDALEESFEQAGHSSAARRQLKSKGKSKGSKGSKGDTKTKTVEEVKSWNVTPFCGRATDGFDPIADAAEFCFTKGKNVPTEDQVCGYNMQTPLVFDKIASKTGTVDIEASCPKVPHNCPAYTPEIENDELLDPDMVKPNFCQMKRKDYMLLYRPNGPSVFPDDRPDIFVEVLIPSTRQIIPFYREDRYFQFAQGRIPFDKSLQDDKDKYNIIYNEQEKLGGQGFKLRYNGKRGPGAWGSCSYSPIAFDLNGDGVVSHITDDVNGFEIDITGDGDVEHLSEWFAKEEGILVDLHDEDGIKLKDFTDGSGTITGNHLLGDMAGKYTDGFDKLATYDDNCDDKLTGRELDGLYIWVDANSNLKMDTGELHELDEYNIVALNTVHDNLKSYALLDNGEHMLMQDLWFDAFEADRRLKSQELARRRQLMLADVVGEPSLEEDCDAAIICSNEALVCPANVEECWDGSFVSRTGPNCEFEPCLTQCKEDNHCPQPRCIGGGFCPKNICIKGQCVWEKEEPECKDTSQCPVPICIEGMFCPNYICVEGECVQEEDTTVCPQDVEQCRDGSFVSRTGPKCQFEPCLNECKEDNHCPQHSCQPGMFCPKYICVDGQCVAEEKEPECKEDNHCPQPKCIPGLFCPNRICVKGQCVIEKEEPECRDTGDCPQFSCIPEMFCPNYICVEGECVAEKEEPECRDTGDCPQPSCQEGMFCPNYICVKGECVQEEDTTVCPANVKECRDGSFVKRTGPDCEFEPCPCPEEMVGFNELCDFEGQCKYGVETCCDGSTHPQFVMTCDDRGTAQGYHSEACMTVTCHESEDKNFLAPPKDTKAPEAPDSPSPDDRTTDKAFTKGDPHFKTFGGELYDYHGECDLVLLHNPDFKDGMGMDIHIRTKIQDFWSSVESAAVKLGDQIMEIKADPSSSDWLWFDGKPAAVVDGEWNRHELSGFLVRYKQSGDNVREANIHIKGAKEVLVMKTFKSFVRIDIQWQGSDHYKNSVGLLGSHAHNGERLGRTGKLIQNVNTFGQEWQVRREVDGALFHSYEGAVVGQKCVMPPTVASSLRKRRLASGLDTEVAEKACNHLVDPEEKKACVFDVIATQDLSMASTW